METAAEYSEEVQAELALQKQPMELLRFMTCGSVDDGKSTLIGRLLFDCKQLFDDQLQQLELAAELGDVNLANITDGLRAEREQGITIDVAYRYFATPRRKFICADCPGHVQYTRNMVTGASNVNLAVILVDARKGLTEQTRRHSFLASLLGLPHLCICINKMDLVDYSQEVYEQIRSDFEAFSTRLDIRDVTYIPMSALQGDNVVSLSENMPWFHGPPFLDFMEGVHIAGDRNLTDPRLPVQYVVRPRDDAHHDFRGYAGMVASGVFREGDEVVVLPSGRRSKVSELRVFEEPMAEARAPQSVIMRLADEVDVSRGDVIAVADNPPFVERNVEGVVCWMVDEALTERRKLLIKHGTRTTQAICSSIDSKVDIHSLERVDAEGELGLNEIGRVSFRTAEPLVYDPYRDNRAMGSFIVIDPVTNYTVGAGMVRHPSSMLPSEGGEPEYVI